MFWVPRALWVLVQYGEPTWLPHASLVPVEDSNLWSLTDIPQSAFLVILDGPALGPAATLAIAGTAEEAMDNA